VQRQDLGVVQALRRLLRPLDGFLSLDGVFVESHFAVSGSVRSSVRARGSSAAAQKYYAKKGPAVRRSADVGPA
jgi:hypothetical protein